jgi:PAS domain S-box-containing protein
VAEKPISPDPGKGLRMSEKDLHEIVNQNEKQYRNILDSIEDGYYEVDIAGKLTFFNDSLCKIYGYARDELMGMSNREYMTPETAQKAYELFNRVYKTGEPAKIFDWEFIKKDGIKIDVEISVSLIKNSIGEAIGFRGIVRDISERKRMEAALKKARNELEHRVEERTKELLKINKQLEKEINERKKAEASLKESEENYRILFDNAPDLIIVINIKGNFLDLNNKFEQESGYSREEIIGESVFTSGILTESSVNLSIPYLEKLLAGKKQILLEVEGVARDGSKVPYELLAVPIKKDGKIVAIQATMRNITDRRQAEAEKEKLQVQLSNAMEIAHLGYWEYDVVNDLFTFNDHFYKIFRTTAKQVGGYTMSLAEYARRFVHPDDMTVIEEENRKAIEATDPHCSRQLEHRMLYADGTVGHISVRFFIIKDDDGRTVKTHGVNQDITEPKRMEEALRRSEEKYRNILENIEDGYYEVDIAGNYTFFNKSMCRILGYSVDELMGKNNREYMDGENAKKVYQAFHDMYQTGIATKALDWKLIRKDGSECFVETVVSLITDINNNKVGFRGIARDVSERKSIEEQLNQARKMESIGTLTGGIAHDFNNIMGIIIGNTELALDDVPEWNPAYSNLEEIKKASLRATNIVRQLLSFSRKTDQKLQPIEIDLVIKDALRFLRSTIPTSIDIHQDIQAMDEVILANPTQINQIMMNLCINASHAMEQTGGNITVNVEKMILDNNSAKDYPDLKSRKHVKVTVSDTGPGIDPAIIDRIFDPYFTTKEVGKGSGMGLAMVQGIVKNHSGAILVDSRPGQGTTFTILFPLVEGKTAVETETIQALPMGSETILFVDDELSIVKMVREMLERLGYKVETAITPQDALERFRLNPDHFDLVITDMTMPQMTGVKLSEKIMGIRPDIPVIICTGHSVLIDEERAKQLGIAAYVMKPIIMTEIAKTLREVLDVGRIGA